MPIDEATKQYVDHWGQKITDKVEVRLGQVASDIHKQVSAELTTVVNTVNALNARLASGFDSLIEFRGETKTTLNTLGRSMDTVIANLSGVISTQQDQGGQIGNLATRCERRHDKDTDEHTAATALANKVERLEESHATVLRKIDNGDAKFNELETTDVRMQVMEETRKQERELLWKRIAQITALTGSLGLGTLIGLLCQYLLK